MRQQHRPKTCPIFHCGLLLCLIRTPPSHLYLRNRGKHSWLKQLNITTIVLDCSHFPHPEDGVWRFFSFSYF